MLNKYYFWLKILALSGIVLAIYLLYEQATLPAFTPCYVNSVVNCDAIIKGEVAKTFGIPTPIYGLVGYVLILFAATARRAKLLFGIATGGLIFCLTIGYIELFQLHTICPVCITCQLLMIAVFTLSALVLRQRSETV